MQRSRYNCCRAVSELPNVLRKSPPLLDTLDAANDEEVRRHSNLTADDARFFLHVSLLLLQPPHAFLLSSSLWFCTPRMETRYFSQLRMTMCSGKTNQTFERVQENLSAWFHSPGDAAGYIDGVSSSQSSCGVRNLEIQRCLHFYVRERAASHDACLLLAFFVPLVWLIHFHCIVLSAGWRGRWWSLKKCTGRQRQTHTHTHQGELTPPVGCCCCCF